MLYIEEQADLASTIKSMVLDLPPHWDEQKHTFLTRLINPLEAASVEIGIASIASTPSALGAACRTCPGEVV